MEVWMERESLLSQVTGLEALLPASQGLPLGSPAYQVQPEAPWLLRSVQAIVMAPRLMLWKAQEFVLDRELAQAASHRLLRPLVVVGWALSIPAEGWVSSRWAMMRKAGRCLA